MTRLVRAARSFGRFWWDFLIGDTPELFVAVFVIIVVSLLLRSYHVAAVIVLPAMAVVSLLTSALRGRRSSRLLIDGDSMAPAVEAPIPSQGDHPNRSEPSDPE